MTPDDRTKRRRPRGRAGAVPYLFLAPAMVLFVAVHGAAHRLHGLPQPAPHPGVRARPRHAAPAREVFAGLDNYAAALGDGELWAGLAAGARLRRAGAGRDARPRPAVRAAAGHRRTYGSPGSPGSRSSCRTRCRAWPPRCCGASSTCRALSPFQGLLELLDGEATCSARARSSTRWRTSPSGAASASTCSCSTPRCGPSRASYYEAARIDGASELQIALRIKIPLLTPGDHPDHGLLASSPRSRCSPSRPRCGR